MRILHTSDWHLGRSFHGVDLLPAQATYLDHLVETVRDEQVDLVLECSGKFRSAEALERYFAAGVKKVIVAAPVKAGALNIVMGVNDGDYDAASHHIISNASCTTNCLAPVAKVLNDLVGIEKGLVAA